MAEDISNSIIIQVILVALIMAMFVYSTATKVNGRGVRQDIIESQLAMFIDAGEQGMIFEVFKLNADGFIEDIKVEGGKIFVKIDGLGFSQGKKYFTPYDIKVEKLENKFKIIIT